MGVLSFIQRVFPDHTMPERKGNSYTVRPLHSDIEKLGDLAEYERRINGILVFKQRCVSLFFKHTQDLFDAHGIGGVLVNGKTKMACVKDPNHSFIELKMGWKMANSNKVVMKAISCPFQPTSGMVDDNFVDYTRVETASAYHSYEIGMTTYDGMNRNAVIHVNIATGVLPEHELPEWFVQCLKSIL